MIEQFEVVITPFNRKRTARVYLPEDYYQNDSRYPVLYMHDGQNLFKDEDANYGLSWGISEYLTESGRKMIVVGLDCNHEGYKRLDEYGPWPSEEMSRVFPVDEATIGGEGKLYIDYIVKELKPMIDAAYRTKTEETSMAGSSMGGLISTYAACTYPDIFKRIASISSAYWFNQKEIESLIENSDLSSIEKFYMDIGTNEDTQSIGSKRYVDSSERVHHILKNRITDLRFNIIDGAVHNEQAWRERVPAIFEFLFEDDSN
ncbi:alpha/beta hydrolase [Actinomycetes bacterium NPDC127524]